MACSPAPSRSLVVTVTVRVWFLLLRIARTRAVTTGLSQVTDSSRVEIMS